MNKDNIIDATAESLRQTQFTLILFSWMIKQNGPPYMSLQKKILANKISR